MIFNLTPLPKNNIFLKQNYCNGHSKLVKTSAGLLLTGVVVKNCGRFITNWNSSYYFKSGKLVLLPIGAKLLQIGAVITNQVRFVTKRANYYYKSAHYSCLDKAALSLVMTRYVINFTLGVPQLSIEDFSSNFPSIKAKIKHCSKNEISH